MQKKAAGLTLIEILVALAIVAIAMLAVIKATGQGVRSQMHLQNKTLAWWVGAQAANEWRCGLLTVTDASTEYKTIILNQTFYWHAKLIKTSNPRIDKLMISIYTSENHSGADREPIETLQTYRYQDNLS